MAQDFLRPDINPPPLKVIMDVVPHDRDSAPLKDEEKQRLLNALNDLGEPADDSAGTDHAADKVLTADEASGDTDHGPLDFSTITMLSALLRGSETT